MGDPCGVGPEIVVQALASGAPYGHCRPVVVGDPVALTRAIDLLQAPLQLRFCRDLTKVPAEPGTLALYPISKLTPEDVVYGHPGRPAAQATIDAIEVATRAAMARQVQAVCTCPIHKANLHQQGFDFPGHTEFLAHLTQTSDVVMMLAGPRLRVALVTIHEALARIPELLTPDLLQSVIEITGKALKQDFAIEIPRIAVAGLNPHSGEQGRFGREEINIISPVVESFAQAPFHVTGPYPPDTVFLRAYSGEFDAVVAMYHDQGLIPIKLVHFNDAVNITLGLPIIRTSVDHGT
ncbi:MAG TPA: 4-hydroxythreonine-4-phosphate dehydrogenase PdxA, partial [Syntrophobacteraceae bacterium]|nr:4-hydroxythreonine-4-phosphate dehydrogenase PdxA [Syntrophobacteraceae bacterium]